MKLYLYAAAGAVILAALAVFVYDQRNIGGAAERAKQEKANAEFRVRASEGAVDYDTCDDAGGLYDFTRRTCKLP